MASDYARLLSAPKTSFFVFGPRGTGKSTWVRAKFPQAKRFDLLDEALYQRLLANIGDFASELRALPSRTEWVCIDEVQRLPGLLNEVHRFIEDRRFRFVLLGSSARKLRRGGVNLLAGRAIERHMHPFVPAELGSDFDLERALRTGLLPLIWDSPAAEETLQAYVQTYLKEEIQAEALARNLPGFARFLPVAALCHGQVLSVSSLARDAGVARTTISSYVEVLEQTLLAFRLPAFEARLRVRERKHPKFYFCDSGLVRALKRQLGPVASEERGALFEGLVAQLLRAYRDYRKLCDEIAYWAPTEAKQVEVDFLLLRGREQIAIEAKASKRLKEEHLGGLRAISELATARKRVLVYLGAERLKTPDGIEVFPFADFCELLAAGKL